MNWKGRYSMDEHDDDLESTLHEGAEQETDEFPSTGDELDEQAADGSDDDDEDLNLDDDDAEL
jgi:hypothetical protein